VSWYKNDDFHVFVKLPKFHGSDKNSVIEES